MKNLKIILIGIILFIVFIFLMVMNYQESNHKTNMLNKNYIYKLDKIIIIGDSRMELIEKNRNKMNLPKNIVFDARSGAKISWLYSEGIPKLYEIIKNKNYNYHVLFNLGVNDIDSNTPVEKIVEQYFETYKKIITTNNKIKFYILSVNPVDEDIIYSNFDKKNKRTTEKVEYFNNKMINLIKKENIKNLKYCDSYNSLNFEMPDGLHYSYKTDKEIMKYIIEKCVKY